MDARAFRATLSNMVMFSVTIRALVFSASRLMLIDRVIGFAMLLPFTLLGLRVGNRLHGRLSREQLLRLFGILVLLTGASVLARALIGES
jgi:uncharacterized membrane protein YfcA